MSDFPRRLGLLVVSSLLLFVPVRAQRAGARRASAAAPPRAAALPRLVVQYGHAEPVDGVAFSREGRYAVTGSWGEGVAVSYPEAARQLGLTEGALKVAVHRLRRRYRELLRQGAKLVETAQDVLDELRPAARPASKSPAQSPVAPHSCRRGRPSAPRPERTSR